MVYADINDQNTILDSQNNKPNNIKMFQRASIFQRVLAVLFDYLIISPIVSFICVSFFTSGLQLYQKFPNSVEADLILIQIAIAFVFIFTLIQTIFIYFSGGTPGQIFTKTFIEFKNKDSNLFLQAWLRQIGFAVSILFCGIPFLSILYKNDQRALFERMTESAVNTLVVNPLKILNWGKSEYRYISVFFTIFIFFGIALSVFSFKHLYEKTITSNFKYEKLNKEHYFCDELKNVKQENKLTVATALNIVGVLSDTCLNQEADFVLWNNFSENDRAMAYFSKYVAISEGLGVDDADSEDDYLAQVCKTSQQSQACILLNTYAGADEVETLKKLNSLRESNLLTTVLKYEITRSQNLPLTIAFEELEKYDTLKAVNKFLITEQLKDFKLDSSRSPASDLSNNGINNDRSKNSNNIFTEKLKKLQSRIDRL